MAPEVIRNENCSEKVDVWSYGVVLWELLTCEVPYKQLDSSAIMWGVGNNSLNLPIPNTCPEGFKLLIQQCWSPKPRNRPPFKIILTHLDIAGEELLRKYDVDYLEQQKTWRSEINDHMKTCVSNSTNIHKYEQDLIRKRQDELKHAKDIRSIYERKLERTNNLYMELSACFLHLEEREKEIQEREKQFGKPYRKIVNSFRKHQFDKIARRRFCAQSPATPEINSSSPSPTTPNSPSSKPTLYATLGSNQQPKSILVQPTSGNGTASRYKKSRHRRVGSGSSIIPKMSPCRDRWIQSEPETRLKNVVDIETQTDIMDISDTDVSPASQSSLKQTITDPELSNTISAHHNSTLCLNFAENNDVPLVENKRHESGLTSDDDEEGEDIDDNMPEDTTSSSQNMTVSVGVSSSMATSMLTSVMTGSNLSYDNSQDSYNNFREYSDDDHLDQLDRKVRELSETASTISTVSSTATIVNKNSLQNCYCNSSAVLDKNEYCNNNLNNNKTSTKSDNNLNNTKCYCSHNHSANESHDDVSPSWSDEEEDGKKFDYSFSLRRKW